MSTPPEPDHPPAHADLAALQRDALTARIQSEQERHRPMTDHPTTQHPEQLIVACFIAYLDALAAAGAAGEIDAHAGAPHLPHALQTGTPVRLAEVLSLSAHDVLFILSNGAVPHVSVADAAAAQAFVAHRRHLAQAAADGWAQHRRAGREEAR